MSKTRLNREHPGPEAWQVWLAYVHFEGHDGGKERPVLVIEVNGSTCAIAEITSKPPVFESDLQVTDLHSAGLGRASVIKAGNVKKISRPYLSSFLGTLSDLDRDAMKELIGNLSTAGKTGSH